MRFFYGIVVALFLVSSGALASTFDDLVEKLVKGEDFRVRVAAALELGKLADPNALDPLINALGDPHASVRAAAAAALEQIGDASALPALKERRLDRSDAVRRAIRSAISTLEQPSESRPTKVLVQIGAMRNQTAVKGTSIEAELERESRKKLGQLPGIEVLSDTPDGRQEAKKKSIPVVLVSGHIQKLRAVREGREIVYTASVEYILHSMPGQSIAAKVSGNATASLSQEEAKDKQRANDLRRQVLGAAIASALRGAPRALLAAARL